MAHGSGFTANSSVVHAREWARSGRRRPEARSSSQGGRTMISSLVQRLAHVMRVVALSLVLAVSLQAQTSGLMLSGTVTGSSGPLANAAITVTNVATGQTVQAQAGVLGYYSVPNLTPGEYQVSVSAPGFESKVVPVTLGPNVGQTVDLALSPASGQGGLSLQDLGI